MNTPLRSATSLRAPRRASRFAKRLRALGPGLLAGASDDDPSGIGTYAQAGAQTGLQLLWLMPISCALMIAVQLISAQIGRVTGHGLAANLSRHTPRWVVLPLLSMLVVTNTATLGADLAAMGAAVTLLLPGRAMAYAAGLGLLSVTIEVWLPFSRLAALLKWMTLSLLAYVGTAWASAVPWRQVAFHTLVPELHARRDFAQMAVAVVGTSVSPCMLFWQSSLEVEAQQAAPGERPLRHAPRQAGAQMVKVRFDTWTGMIASTVIAYFVMLTAAVALHGHGPGHLDSAADLAAALRPVVGRFASALFALGLVGAGLLAVPVLAGSAGYALAEAFDWPRGLERRPAQARRFYAVIAAATLVGIGLGFLGIPPMKALVGVSVLSGVIDVPLLAAMMVIATRPAVMGRFAISAPLRVGGWLATALMLACTVAMLIA